MPNPNPQPNYAAQGATSQQATVLAGQSDKAHAQVQQNAAQMQGAVQPAVPAGAPALPPQTRAPETVNLTPNDQGPQGMPPGNPEDMAFLYQDPQTPADLQTIMSQAQQQMYSRDTPVPTRLLRYLPILRQMAYDPTAPASVQAFYRHVVDSIERRRTQ